MIPTTAGQSLVKSTLALKPVDVNSIPVLEEVSSSDFKRFVYTGLSATVSLPLVKTSRNALFGLNIDGFVPHYNYAGGSRFFKNLSPLQVFPEALGFVETKQEFIMLPPIVNYLSHRFVAGNVKVGVRVQSNTSQSGNVFITQASSVTRKLYKDGDAYGGLQFLNTSYAQSDYMSSGFLLGDLSLNRNFSITPIRRDPAVRMDFDAKFQHFYWLPNTLIDNKHKGNTISGLFLEDWLLFGILSDVPNQNSNQVTFSFFFDYSDVQFYQPILPIIPTAPANFGRQIFRLSETLNTIPNFNFSTMIFLPGGSGLSEDEVDNLKIED